MSSLASNAYPSRGRIDRLAYCLRVVKVTAGAEFKLKYAGSLLGYVWSLAKPLGLFGILLIVFGKFFHLGNIPHYSIYLLTGLVLWMYFTDSTSLSMYSVVGRAATITKLSFPRVLVPLSITVSCATTLGVNLVAVGVFVAANRLVPTIHWLLLIPLLLELYIFTLGVSLILATLYVRLRDLGQLWDLVLQLMFYAQPIIYPAGYLPPWWKPIAFLSPFTQVVADGRKVMLPGVPSLTPADVYGSPFGELIPVAVAFAFLIGGYLLLRRQAPWFAERV